MSRHGVTVSLLLRHSSPPLNMNLAGTESACCERPRDSAILTPQVWVNRAKVEATVTVGGRVGNPRVTSGTNQGRAIRPWNRYREASRNRRCITRNGGI